MRVLHVLDASADWEQRIGVHQLLDRLRGECSQHVLSIDPRIPPADWFSPHNVMRSPMRFGVPFTAAPAIRRVIDAHDVNVIHAWGTDAVLAAAAASGGRCAIVLERFDPRMTSREAKALRSLVESQRCAVACSTGTVRRRLVECGVAQDRCVVIRPGVDFGRINAVKKDSSIRRSLGIDEGSRVWLASYPITACSAHDRIVWGGFLQCYMNAKHRLIVHGRLSETSRLRRLSDPLPPRGAVIWPGDRHRYEDLIATTDCLIITPTADVPTTAIAWAMAASVPVIGSAVYSVAEYIAHKQNGLLIKPERGPGMAIRIVEQAAMIDTLGKQREAARGQAYQAFGLRRYADQHLRLYQNLTTGAPPVDGIIDSAIEM